MWSRFKRWRAIRLGGRARINTRTLNHSWGNDNVQDAVKWKSETYLLTLYGTNEETKRMRLNVYIDITKRGEKND